MNRTARCSCGKSAPSSDREHLAFFEFRGEGSKTATEDCKNCGYHLVAHAPDHPRRGQIPVCLDFTPKGSQEFDGYYCGCRGWE
jgi:hypothetical protein